MDNPLLLRVTDRDVDTAVWSDPRQAARCQESVFDNSAAETPESCLF